VGGTRFELVTAGV